ncbi:MAG: choice-of-anchor V domain-containing protein, partial [Bacteroidia bacterium]|nr:choice-of-anchor V domain-containing protein [Bacteroidia bacterium]
MMKRRLYLWGLALLATSLFIHAGQNSSTPPAGHTNAPGEGNCTSCHTGILNTIVSPFGGPLTLNITQNGQPFNPANGYTPGTTYDFSVTASVPGITRYGFQATFINPANQQGVGTFIAGPGTTVTSGGNNRRYISHNNDTQAPGGSKTWTFRWTAPTGDNLPVAQFYLTMNAANGNGNTSGDQIYAFNASFQPAATQQNSIQAQVLGNNPNYCPGGSITVAYQATGTYAPGNTFSLEISALNGMFPGQIIGGGTSDPNGQI